MVDRSKYNIYVLGFSFLLLFCAFSTTQSFTTTLNKDLGYISLSILYGTFAMFVFVAPAIESKMGPRITLVIGGAAYAMYVGASAKVTPTLYLSASFVIGLGAAILWTAQGHVLSLNSTPSNIGEHSGLFWLLFQSNGVLGNLLAAVLINAGYSMTMVFTLLFGLAVVGVACMLLLRKPKQVDTTVVQVKPSTREILSSVAKLHTEKQFLLYCGLFLFSGYSQSLMYGRFPPLCGKDWLGWVMASNGAAEALGSYIYGRMSDSKLFGTKRCIYIASVFWVLSAVLIPFIDSFHPYSFFVISIAMGLGDAGYNTQISAILSSVYGKKNDNDVDRSPAAFAGLKCSHSLTMMAGLLLGIVGSPLLFCVLLVISLAIALLMFACANSIRDIESYRQEAPEKLAHIKYDAVKDEEASKM